MTIDIYSQILKELEEQRKKKGNFPQLLEFYQRLLHVQSRVEKNIASLLEPSLSSEAINARLQRGLPLIRFDELALDWPLLRGTFTQVATIFADYSDLFGELPERLKEPKASRLLTKKAVKAWFEGAELPSSLADGDINQNLLRAIIQATMRPFLTSHAKTLIPSIEQERWRRKYCPVCGGSPDFSFLDTERGSRWLMCSRCDTEWIFQRLECPYCGTQDQKALAYFSDEEGLYRLYTCEQCKRYLKAIDLRQAKSEVLLPLERFYTIDMDSQAREQGYNP